MAEKSLLAGKPLMVWPCNPDTILLLKIDHFKDFQI